MPITQDSVGGYSSKALKRMFGEDTPPEEKVPEQKPSAMKYTKEFFDSARNGNAKNMIPKRPKKVIRKPSKKKAKRKRR